MGRVPEPAEAVATPLERRLAALDARIAESRRAASRHRLFAVLGASPGSILPLLGLGTDFGVHAVVTGSVVVVGLEAWRWIRARADVRAAEAERRALVDDRS